MKKINSFRGHRGDIRSLVCLSQDKLISGGDDHIVRLWNVSSGVCLQAMNGHTKGIYSLTVLSLDMIASSSFDRSIIL